MKSNLKIKSLFLHPLQLFVHHAQFFGEVLPQESHLLHQNLVFPQDLFPFEQQLFEVFRHKDMD